MDTIYISKKKAEKYGFDYNLIAAQCYFGLPVRPDFEGTYCIADAHTCPIWIIPCKREDAVYSIRLRYNKVSKTYYFKNFEF